MTNATRTRQVRLAIDGILQANGIDNLKVSLDIASAVGRIIDSENPVKTREQIVASVKRSLAAGETRQERILAMRGEIEQRLRIRPNGPEWEDFLEWAYKQPESLSKFLDWWLSDEWRRSHPPANPKNWYVFWPQAFQATGHPLGLRVEV